MGPPLGLQSQISDGIVVDYFGGTAWTFAEAPVFQAVREILGGQAPDPAALLQIGWELAPFYCPDCTQNYCRADWRSPDGSRRNTMGWCPRNHEHKIND